MTFKPILNYLIRKHVKKDQRVPTLVYGAMVQRVAIVSSEKYAPEASEYAKRLRSRGVQTVDFFLVFNSSKSEAKFENRIKAVTISPKNFSLFGAPINKPDLERALLEKYDTLIDLNVGQSIEADWIIVQLNANWKVGKKLKNRENLLDLMIDGNLDGRQLISQIDDYLLNLNKPKAA
ncbi:MAG: hypothetical protein R2813_07455 [Flavobacteriales bacterium]